MEAQKIAIVALIVVVIILLLCRKKKTSSQTCTSDANCTEFGRNKCRSGVCSECNSDSDCPGADICDSGRCGAPQPAEVPDYDSVAYRGAVQVGLTGTPFSGDGPAIFAYESGGPQYAVGLYTPIVDENITACSIDFQSRINNISDNFTGGRLRIEFREVASPTIPVAISDWLTPKALLPVANVRAASSVLGMAGTLLAGRQYFGLVVGDNATGVGFMTHAITVRKSS